LAAEAVRQTVDEGPLHGSEEANMLSQDSHTSATALVRANAFRVGGSKTFEGLLR
jgi:hypothetical protein